MFKTFINSLANRLVKGHKKNWPIQSVVFLVIVSPVIFIAIFSYTKTYSDLTNSTLSRRESIAYLAATTLKHQFDRLTDIGTSLATRVRFRQLISEGKWDEAGLILKSVPKDFPFIDRLFLASPDGTLQTDLPPLPDVRGKNFAFRDWYQGVSAGWKPYISGVYKRTTVPQNSVVAVAIPIRTENQKVAGILVLQVQLDTFLEWSRGIEIGRSGFIYFVDRKGLIAAHPGLPPQGDIVDYSNVPVVQKVLRGEHGVAVTWNPIEREEQVSAYAQVPGYGWGVIVAQPKEMAFESRDKSLRFILGLYGFIFLLTCGLAYILLKTFTSLKEAEERTHLLVEATPNGIIMVDREGKITLVNTLTEQLFGYRREEILGQKIEILVPERYRGKHQGYRNSFFANPETRAMGVGRDLYGLRRDGSEMPIEIGLNPITTPEGTFILAAIIDITERKRAEEEIKKLNENLERRAIELETVNKELEAFSYSVSHDLRAPLRSMDGFSQALLEDYGDKLDADGQDYIRRVRAGSQQMGQLIDDMLNLSRVSRKELSLETVNLGSLAQAIAAELKRSEPERQVEFVIAEGISAKGDERLLRVALENLLGNAWKFTGKHPRARIEFGTEQTNGGQVCYVRDDGAGFDMAYADKLFGAFQRLHARTDFPGTGIGLATVQRIINRHGGRVWAEGKVGKGATFYFTLP